MDDYHYSSFTYVLLTPVTGNATRWCQDNNRLSSNNFHIHISLTFSLWKHQKTAPFPFLSFKVVKCQVGYQCKLSQLEKNCFVKCHWLIAQKQFSKWKCCSQTNTEQALHNDIATKLIQNKSSMANVHECCSEWKKFSSMKLNAKSMKRFWVWMGICLPWSVPDSVVNAICFASNQCGKKILPCNQVMVATEKEILHFWPSTTAWEWWFFCQMMMSGKQRLILASTTNCGTILIPAVMAHLEVH